MLLGLLACTMVEPPPPAAPAGRPPLPEGAIEVVVVPAQPPADDRAFEVQRKAIFAALRARVDQLTAHGSYHCCIQVPCSHCALMAGGCRCGPGLQAGEPVCHDCALMWQRGQGSVEGVDPARVCSFLEAERDMRGGGGRCAPGGG